MVLPSRPDFEVLGVFNPAVARHDGQVVLLLRVAEAPQKMSAGLAAAPIFNSVTGRVEIKRWLVTPKGPDVSDPRLVVDNGRTWLTSMSHFRVARSTDGIHFEGEGLPAFSAGTTLHPRGIVAIQQQRPQRVVGRIARDAVIDREPGILPADVNAERNGVVADLGVVPPALARSRDESVIAPGLEVR